MPSEAGVELDRSSVPLDLAAVERLSTAFNRCFDTLDADDDLFSADAFFDIYPPLWRVQIVGRPLWPSYAPSPRARQTPGCCASSLRSPAS